MSETDRLREERGQLQAKVDWLATELAKHQHTQADRDRWRQYAIEARTILDQIGIDAEQAYQTDAGAHHDTNCWRRHTRCLADRITSQIEGDQQ